MQTIVMLVTIGHVKSNHLLGKGINLAGPKVKEKSKLSALTGTKCESNPLKTRTVFDKKELLKITSAVLPNLNS